MRVCRRKVSVSFSVKEGKPITSNPPYGFVKDPEDKNHWLVDEEAAEVVRKIFRLTVEGMGPYQIAKQIIRIFKITHSLVIPTLSCCLIIGRFFNLFLRDRRRERGGQGEADSGGGSVSGRTLAYARNKLRL